MSRSTLIAMLAFSPLAACASAEVKAPNASTDTATYSVTYVGHWSKMTFPTDYPKSGLIGGPHFSGLIGATHNRDYEIVREGAPPTRGLERLSEEGKHSPLDEEIRSAIGIGGAGTLIETGGVDPTGTVKTTFVADANHPMLSLVAMIAPSPDWFAGAPDIALYDNGSWVPRTEVDVFAWDSGGDDGTTYEADDKDNNPKKATMKNEALDFVKNGQRVLVGHLVIEKL